MTIFFTLLFKLIPFYLFIFLGFIAGKYLRAHKESIASIVIYIVTPVIVFHGAATTTINIGTMSLPLIFFLISSGMCLLVYRIVKHIWQDSTRNILAFTAGSGNTGYFGLPVAIAIFGEKATPLVVLCIMGFVLYENSLGFFITARGHHTVGESIRKVLKLPSIYAFIFGLLVNISGIPMGSIYLDTVTIFRGAYTLLGMMIIGLGLSAIKEFRFDYKFIFVSFFVKFLLWPAVVALVIVADTYLFRIFDNSIHKVMILISVVPLAANTVAYATALRAQPEKASMAVLLSTVFALFYIPLVAGIFLK